MPGSHYSATAAQMRELANKEGDPVLKEKLLGLAEQYDKLARRAQVRAQNCVNRRNE